MNKKNIVILFFVVLQFFPVFIFNLNINESDKAKYKNFFYEECIDSYTKNIIESYIGKEKISGNHIDLIKLKAKDDMHDYCYELSNKTNVFKLLNLILSTIFIFVPVAWLISFFIFKDLPNNYNTNRSIFVKFFKKIIYFLIVLLVLLLCSFTSIAFCFNDIALHSFFIRFKYIVAIPFLISIYILACSFGEAFALSGQRTHLRMLDVAMKDKD